MGKEEKTGSLLKVHVAPQSREFCLLTLVPTQQTSFWLHVEGQRSSFRSMLGSKVNCTGWVRHIAGLCATVASSIINPASRYTHVAWRIALLRTVKMTTHIQIWKFIPLIFQRQCFIKREKLFLLIIANRSYYSQPSRKIIWAVSGISGDREHYDRFVLAVMRNTGHLAIKKKWKHSKNVCGEMNNTRAFNSFVNTLKCQSYTLKCQTY